VKIDMRKKAQILLLLIFAQASVAEGQIYGARFVKDQGQAIGAARIDGTASAIIEKSDSLIPGYKMNCIGDEGRVLAGVFGIGYNEGNIRNGVESNLSQLFAAGSLFQFAIRGDSSLLDQLHPTTKRVIREAIGSAENYIVLKMGNGIGTGHVLPIPFDGLNVQGGSVSGAANSLYVKRYSIQNPETFEKCKHKLCPEELAPINWSLPEELPLGQEFFNLPDSVSVFYAHAVLKLSRTSGFTEGLLGLYKDNYVAYNKDLEGQVVTPEETPKPFLSLNCRMVRYASER
jgi:hypothetical protein